MGWWRGFTHSDLYAALLGEHDAYMDYRRELMQAIGELTSTQKSQLLLHLLEDDHQGLDIIDSRKWRWHEYTTEARLRPTDCQCSRCLEANRAVAEHLGGGASSGQGEPRPEPGDHG